MTAKSAEIFALLTLRMSKSCAQPSVPVVFEQGRTGKLREAARAKLPERRKPGRSGNKQTAWNGGTMGSMKKWMLGVALAAGIVGMGAAPAQAARVGIYIGARAPYPGPGYVWVNGYWANGYFVPGYWNYVGAGPVFRGGIVLGHGPYYGRHFGHRW
jgi:hypothetical protein